jgi:hypothetical protein
MVILGTILVYHFKDEKRLRNCSLAHKLLKADSNF